MSTKAEVEYFLTDLVTKIKIFQIVFLERENFKETLKELGYTQSDCVEEIKQLTYENYYKGPTPDDMNQGKFWEFGKEIKKIEVYIKINRGRANKPVLCISFHKAKFKISHPLK